MKRYVVVIPGCATHTNATLLDVARWALGGEQHCPSPQQFDRLSRIKVGGVVVSSKHGWSVTRRMDS